MKRSKGKKHDGISRPSNDVPDITPITEYFLPLFI